MGMLFCPTASPFDLEDACVRQSWSALVPFALVVLYLLVLVLTPVFSKVISFTSPFRDFLPLDEAEALDYDASKQSNNGATVLEKKKPALWFTVVLAVASFLGVAGWFTVYVYSFVKGNSGHLAIIRAHLFAFTWLYATLKPARFPTVEPPYDVFVLYVLHLVGAILMLGGVIYDHNIYHDPLPSRLVLGALIANLALTFSLVVLIFSRPLALPSAIVTKEDVWKHVSPEDYTSLWGWTSFSWVAPLVKKGTNETLKEDDVWWLSSTVRARPFFRKFSILDTKRSLLWRIWASNSQDIILDFIGTLISVFFNYAGPFFLKRIIDAIDSGDPAARARAYLFAVLMFVAQVLKSEADIQHLWHGRRASVRIRSSLMSAIYEKALKRKDFSGIVNKQEKEKAATGEETKKEKKERQDKKDKADEPKSGADIGKIVNLMAGDANRISMIVSGMYFIYGAPFEIVIASIFLYQLLGLSAFAGFGALILVWPLNQYLARRSIRIQKGVLAARDGRMAILNELLGALKFVKFFAWEERWIGRTLDARAKELKWLVKSRMNSIMFQTVWSTAPIAVSVISFLTYVVRGNELTVGTAFTAIALFSMIRQPLNVIPTWIVQILQTRVAMQRIETFLNEDEVGPQVSALKEDTLNEFSDIKNLGLSNASFKWNAVEEKDKNAEKDKKAKGKGKDKKNGKTDPAQDIEAAISDSLSSDISQAGTEAPAQDHQFELRDISVVFPEGVLSVVTGPTASGKSALLLSMLGEMTLLPGGKILMRKDPFHVYDNGLLHTISYCAQTPWLQHQSIKENILFGTPLDAARYADVLDACALRPDLKILEDGDETEIGARGISLSGGQKARVALARAIYSRSKFVLLDDPLSAVDSHTSRFLFENLFMGPLMKGRTVVLVTHHVELVLPGAHYLVRMLDGRIDMQGTVKELRESGALEAITLEEAIEEQHENEQKADEGEEAEATETIQAEAAAADGDVTADGEATVKKTKKARKLVKDEEREVGGVKWNIYKTYLKASSYWTWCVLFLLVLCMQGLGFFEKYWIKIWSEAYGTDATNSFAHFYTSGGDIEQYSLISTTVAPHHFTSSPKGVVGSLGIEDHLPSAHEKPLFYVGIYALIGLVTVICSISSSATQYTGALHASRNLFSRLLGTVVRATMRWHDVTPAGRILNRFSKDIETVDSNIASSLQMVNQSLSSLFTSMMVVCIVFPGFIFPAVFIGFFYYKLSIGYLNTGRDLRRMESTSRSPIFSGFAELLEGIVTVRAFSAEQRFMNGLYSKIDLTLQMFYHFWMTNRWLLIRFDFLSALAVFSTSMFALSSNSATQPGWAGWAALCITSTLAFTNNIYWTCRFWTQLELDLNSVERIVEYLDLPQEPPAVIENSRPPAAWPSSTGPNEERLLEVKNLEVRYAPDLPAVLHDISFSLRARERIGLLGRTGSGKSTLAMSILRFIDPAKGQIIIDGVDITSIGINDLRSRLTFIPQDATLFSGTIRDNLDPFGDYSDLECLDALHRVQMISDSAYGSQRASRAPSIHNVEREETDATAVDSPEASGSGTVSPSRAPSESTTVAGGDSSADGKGAGPVKISLATDVSAGGLNFSAGQRQLIAMARALLRQSAVVVLDEATSSIDFATDAKIQKTIREEFGNSLLLTVAHRLRTVIDYDRLIVLDAGHIVEFDTPYNLIQREDGVFRGMCLKSGSFAELEEAAKGKAEQDTASK